MFRLKYRLAHYIEEIFYMSQIYDIGPTALTDGCTSAPKEGVQRIFFSLLKNSTASVGYEPANFVAKGQHATSSLPLAS